MDERTTGPPLLSSFSPGPFPDLVRRVASLLDSQGIEGFLVGGIVRDTLLGRETEDVDIAVAGNVERTGRILAEHLGGRFVRLHEEWDIARVVIPSDEGPAYVDLNSATRGISQNLARRDFTVDAMAVPLVEVVAGSPWRGLLDPFDGLADLREGIVRPLGPQVFEDDPARLLRAVRIAVQLKFRLSEDAIVRIRSGAPLVAQVAPERIKDEFLKIMACPAAPESIRMLDSLGLLCSFLPELEVAKGVTQPREHYWDVFNHLVETTGKIEEVLAGSEGEHGVTELVPEYDGLEDHFREHVSDGHTRLTLLKVVALLHDVAKPATKTTESTGRIRFLGHHSSGAEIVERILKRLRFSGRGVALARLMVQNHLRPTQMAQKGEMPSGKAIYRYYRDVGDAAIDVLYLNMADYLAARGPNLGEDEWRDHTDLIRYILNEGLRQKTPETLPKLVDGNDIMDRFALAPGRLVGELLNLVHEAQANQDIMNKEEAYELVRTNLESGGSGA